ncbi:NosL family protein [Desulfosarcina ovata subsp. sediminis]|uniref:NosL family protein n=1 Tax=Desulfosarcina ovata subsp. sediminis TaxID=885957 RepID=A0A5K7ZZM3_9BACT|nr:nitrous oxide reductase accessory protein NosL [Desulfosarcina ovata]BBO85616.1 NosL family protein [Desulfosarcina ovata subsp. sediminis]
MQNKTARVLALMGILVCLLWTLPPSGMAGQDDISAIPHCPICGMDRHQFAHSRMLIHYADGSQFGACSLHCAALELAYHPGKIPVTIEVADLNTHRLVDVETATWVIGGKKMGVMTANAKWAFASAEDARRFVEKEGGRIADFEAAISAAYEDMYKDTRMIREKRKRMRQMKHGQMTPE